MKTAIPAAEINKHQARTAATLRGLLEAAERVFVRDGYERAQIETIAAEAGRTKGAVYAHFRSKEDIFFALIEKKVKGRRDEFLRASEGMNIDPRRAAVKQLFLGALQDESWPILMLEFKLLALRNKDSLQRMRDLYQLAYEDTSRAMLAGKGFSTDETRERDLVALAVLRGIPSALILEKQFSPMLISSAIAKQVFENIFDALVGIGHSHPPPGTKKVSNRARHPKKP
ncbi:transcriptional regulator, TetR family [Bryocella elongata]|uniref:Transcriptional regulator, TetR family n=2 Tax=Bryocella elongata TaxID=863522 RepID=A0A1H5UN19_9BACT|nr:transcriptional regulator, TetR family [Bryocella elongata]